MLNSILLPDGGLTPFAILAWFGIVFPLVGSVAGFMIGLARKGKKS